MLLAQQSVMPIWGWSLVLIAFLGAALLVMVWVRRRIKSTVESAPEDFTLSDLRRLREAGQIDEQQYQKMRAAIIGGAKAKS